MTVQHGEVDLKSIAISLSCKDRKCTIFCKWKFLIVIQGSRFIDYRSESDRMFVLLESIVKYGSPVLFFLTINSIIRCRRLLTAMKLLRRSRLKSNSVGIVNCTVGQLLMKGNYNCDRRKCLESMSLGLDWVFVYVCFKQRLTLWFPIDDTKSVPYINCPQFVFPCVSNKLTYVYGQGFNLIISRAMIQ